jgi:hypothetical protein
VNLALNSLNRRGFTLQPPGWLSGKWFNLKRSCSSANRLFARAAHGDCKPCQKIVIGGAKNVTCGFGGFARFGEERPMSAQPPANGPIQLPTEAALLTSAALPSTATVVTIVTGAGLGADFVLKKMFGTSSFEGAVIVFAAILSFLATFAAANLPLMWRLALWPLNFCVLVYLVITSSFYLDAVAKQGKQDLPTPGITHAIEQRTIPGGSIR